MDHQPPFTLTPTILNLCTQIAEAVGRLSVLEEQSRSLHLRRISRIRTVQATPHVTPHVTPQVATLLRTLKGEMSRDEIMTKLGLTDRKSFSQRYLQPALQQGLIAMTLPDSRSRLQRYRLRAEQPLGR